MTMKLWALIAGVALAVKIVIALMREHRLRKIMPPGPKGLPLLGNIFQLPLQFQWFKLAEFADKYGEIYSLNLAGQPVVVVSDFTTAGDLLDRRSNIYSDRPSFVVAGEYMTGGLLIAFMPYGDLWRKMRRAAHEGFNSRAMQDYQPLQEKESAVLVSNMFNHPEKWDDNLRRSAASSVLCGVYGWLPINSSADHIVTQINNFMHTIIRALVPGAHLVEIFPSLKCLPEWMAGWKRHANDVRKNANLMFEGFMDEAKQKMDAGTIEPCFAATLLQDEKKFGLSRREGAWLAGIMVGAGAETTAAALSVFMLAMTLYPDVMKRAQAEIDAVVGRDRMPTFADRPNLPYIDAMVKEVQRWKTVGPLALPRRSTQDDWYKGYFIPKGTLVIANTWAMHRDTKYFPDFEEFRPERYLDASGKLADPIPDTHGQGHFSYGSGRRMCVGKDLANQALFIDMASMLWAMDIEATIDENGAPIMPSSTDYVDEGLVVRPAPFKCVMKPRFDEVPAMVSSIVSKFA